MTEKESYIYGLLITDGNIYLTTRNRGRVVLEISKRDEDIVDKLIDEIPNSTKRERTRKTNFSEEFNSVSFNNHRIEFRTWLFECGYPKEDKTNNASIPSVEFSEIDFWRGVIDGDGSLGITSKNIPFVSLITKSENLKNEYLAFLEKKLGIIKKASRNKRDGVYNICITRDNAIKLSRLLYEDCNGFCLKRKYSKFLEIIENDTIRRENV